MSLGVSVLIPTRRRPKQLDRCRVSVEKTASKAEVLTYVDDDDDSYKSWTIKGPRFTRGRMFKALFEKAQYDFVMICGDDVVFETPGWDGTMIKRIPDDKIGAVFGIDGWKNVPGHLLFHKRLVELTGAFPVEFEHFGIDTYLADVMRGVTRLFQVDVMLRHLHFRNGKAENDETYTHTRHSGMDQRDRERLTGFKNRIKQDIQTLKAEIERFAGVGRADAAVGAPT